MNAWAFVKQISFLHKLASDTYGNNLATFHSNIWSHCSQPSTTTTTTTIQCWECSTKHEMWNRHPPPSPPRQFLISHFCSSDKWKIVKFATNDAASQSNIQGWNTFTKIKKISDTNKLCVVHSSVHCLIKKDSRHSQRCTKKRKTFFSVAKFFF